MSPYRLRILLWVATIGLVITTGLAWAWHVQNPVVSEPVAAKADAPLDETSVPEKTEPLDFSKLARKRLQRPLYDAPVNKLPPKKTTTTTVRTPPRPPLNLRFTGTVGTGVGFEAMLVSQSNVSQLVAVGDTLSRPNTDVVVQEVTTDKVVLKRGPHTYSLTLKNSK